MQHPQSSYNTESLGPLFQLGGSWEGNKGHDVSNGETLSSDTPYRESITFEPIGPIKNGNQDLYGLRYTTKTWQQTDNHTLHQELGYWLWSPEDKQVIRCFSNHKGVSVHAGGAYDENSRHFTMSAKATSEEHGISSSPLLNNGMKTLSYDLTLDMLNDSEFKYMEEMHFKNSANENVMIHTDTNSLSRLF